MLETKKGLLGRIKTNVPLDILKSLDVSLAEFGVSYCIDTAENTLDRQKKLQAYRLALNCLDLQYKDDSNNPFFIEKELEIFNCARGYDPKFSKISM